MTARDATARDATARRSQAMTDTMARRDVNTIAPAQISHDTPKHNRTDVLMLHIQQTPP